MEPLEVDSERSSYSVHQYPDPDSVAYATNYPWWGDDEGYVPLVLQRSSFPTSGCKQKQDQAPDSRDRLREENFGSSPQCSIYGPDDLFLAHSPGKIPKRRAACWEKSSQNRSGDEVTSEGGSPNPTVDAIHTLGASIGRQELLSLASTDRGRGSDANASHRRGSRCRRGRAGIGRGGKGLKRGLRKPLEPGVEFKAHLSEATMAFTHSDFDKAELFTLKALQLNPEMFQAHNLLSEIHTARGDKEKALSAAWNGAHTRPRDTQMWSRIASLILERDSDDVEATVRHAIYCYTRIITVDKHNIEARYQRATLNRELGHKRKVILEYESILRELPHDMTILRHLAEMYIELNEADKALQHYKATIAHLQVVEPHNVTTFTWSDVNIVAELYGFQLRYDEGISNVKRLSRWLLGRKDDSCWEHYDEDDREWDFDDNPRRIETAGFTSGRYSPHSYGDGLPLELRIKLGVFRLYSKKQDLTEAITHFEWLDPEDEKANAKIFDYPDLFREAANALRGRQYFEEALRYYQPLRRASAHSDASLFMEIALCYRAVGSKEEAEGCYKRILEHDPGSTEARVALWNMSKEIESLPADVARTRSLPSVFKHKSRRGFSAPSTRSSRSGIFPTLAPPSLASHNSTPSSTRQPDVVQVSAQSEEVQALFVRWQMLCDDRRSSECDDAAWFEAARLLLRTFRDNRIFYPMDRHHKFYGYSKLARAIAHRPKYEKDSLVFKTDSVLETLDGDQIVIPDHYMGITFTEWLHIFLHNALSLAKNGDAKAAYEVIASAYSANVFYHSPKALVAIHVCWLSCALLCEDDETLCNVSRWFMTEYQLITDSYRLFSALNRLCSTRSNSWYNCGPSQKYVLRQLKAMDLSLLGERHKKGFFQARASFTAKDSIRSPIVAENIDVSLLMLYGHILYAGKSYPYAVNYFLRALASDPSNPIIKLSLALGYIHWAFKRQAQNRHQILMQGFAFLMEYYDSRQESGNCSQKQEAEYNVGRAYHLLGLINLAIPYYERCLALGDAVEQEYEQLAMDYEALKDQWSEVEDRDGIRLSWNTLPSSRMEASRLVVPIGALYTPLKEKPDTAVLRYEPVTCKQPCRAVLNPFANVDPRARLWICPFCLSRNQLPQHYKDITQDNIPPELHPASTTIEYKLSRPAPAPPIFVYVVDTCQEEDSLKALKDSLVMSLSLLPPHALVGLITFGTMAQVHELGYTECAKSYVFRGSKDYAAKQVQDMLGLTPSGGMRPNMPAPPGRPPTVGTAARFLLPVQQCEFQLTNTLEQLHKDPWPVANDKRSLRCTGVALSVAVGLLETSFQNAGGRIMLFAGGPATEGPGQVVGPELREPIRSHHDIDRDNIKYYKKALRFYDNIAKRTAHNGHIVDIFAGCLDQVGLLEMKGLPNSTGGHMILTDSFTSSQFKQSFVRVFDKDAEDNLLMGFNASLEVLATKELKVTGLIGHAISLHKKSPLVGDTECGIGNTCSWKMCGIDPTASYGIYFEIANQGGPAQHQQVPQKGMMQFLTYYQHSSGQFHLRVTTVARNLSGPAGDPAIAQSFDQEAAAVLMSRIAVFKAEVDDGPDVLRWVDRMLIRLCARFAEYRKDDPSSFRLEKNFTLYPQFMFHLRRSHFLQVFNSSPDETAFYRHVLNHEYVGDSLVMIQPTLDSYTFDQEGSVPVLLDSASIQPTHILLLDTFFQILIFHGETVAQWRKAGYQDQAEYANFKALLEQPKEDARELVQDRFPLPRFIICDAGGSQARFLLSKLNPSTTHTTNAYGGAQSPQTIFTDDVSLQNFMDHLMKLAVSGTS
ncbi:MAG: hypothetical protein Q9163_005663 [Psora crenata]